MFEKALEIEPGHRATLQALIELYTDAGDFEAVIKQKRSLITARATHADEKFTLSRRDRAASTRRSSRTRRRRSPPTWRRSNLKPGDRELLHDLLELFSETKQWKKAMEILMKLAELDSGAGKARFLIAAGNIANYELHSTDEAVELYNQGLDEDPDDLKAFERIDKIMTAKKDWKNQERNYRKMIKRLGQEPAPEKKQTVVALWHALGEIYRSRLKDFKAAIAGLRGLRAAGSGRDRAPPDPRRAVSAVGAGDLRQAIKEYRQLIKATTDFGQMAAHLKTLRRLLHGAAPVRQGLVRGRARRRSCARATPRSSSSTSSTSPRAFARARARLTEELWQARLPPRRGPLHLARSSRRSASRSPRRAPRSTRTGGSSARTSATSRTTSCCSARCSTTSTRCWACRQPELYLRPESPGELDLANAREKAHLVPSFVVGAGLLQGRPEKELAYVIAQAADVHAAGSLRALAARRADGRRAEDRLPGGAEAGAAEVRGEGGRGAGAWRSTCSTCSARWRRSRSSSWPPSSSASSPTRARPTSTSGRTPST